MMFRSTVNEDESGSDWDDLTPQHTPLAPTTPPPPSHSSRQQPSSLGQGQPRYDEEEEEEAETQSSLVGAAAAAAASLGQGQPRSKDESSPHKSKGRPRSKKRSKQQHSRHEMQQFLANPSLPIEDQFTSVAMATPPQPHPPRTPAVPNPAYIVGRESPPHPPSPHTLTPSHSHPSLGGGGEEEEAGYVFSTVSAANANELELQHKTHRAYMERIAEKSERLSQRCSSEVFSVLRIASDWPIAFLLACLHYCLYHVARKLTCGVAHICSDALLKPFLQCCFNGLLWPLFSLAVQSSRACVLCCAPCLQCCGEGLRHCALLATACRLVEITGGGGGGQRTQTTLVQTV